MAVIICSVSCAGGSALASIVKTREIFHSDVCVLACSIERSIDGTAELGRTVKARHRVRWVVLGVTIGSSDDDVELVTILAIVDGGFSGNPRAPEGALDVGEGWGVVAACSRVDSGITLEVDVECGAEVSSVAELLAFDCVISLESSQAHVAVGVDRCLEIHKRSLVTLRCWRIVGGILGKINISRNYGRWDDIQQRSDSSRKRQRCQWLALGHSHLAVGHKPCAL